MSSDEAIDQSRAELSVANGRMRRFVVMRLGGKLGYAIGPDEADAAIAMSIDLRTAFEDLARRHRFDWVRNPRLLFRW